MPIASSDATVFIKMSWYFLGKIKENYRDEIKSQYLLHSKQKQKQKITENEKCGEIHSTMRETAPVSQISHERRQIWWYWQQPLVAVVSSLLEHCSLSVKRYHLYLLSVLYTSQLKTHIQRQYHTEDYTFITCRKNSCRGPRLQGSPTTRSKQLLQLAVTSFCLENTQLELRAAY